MCSMKRGLDVQMETCRRLITQSGDRYTHVVHYIVRYSVGMTYTSMSLISSPLLYRKSPVLIPAAVEDGENLEKEIPAANPESAEPYYDSAVPDQTWKKS